MRLRLYFSDDWNDASSPCAWALSDGAGGVVQSGFGRLNEMPEAEECVAILPAARITCLTVAMPASSRRRWEAALSFVVEEFTLTDPETNHVVPAASAETGKCALFIVDKAWLKTILACCQAAGLNLRSVLPELILPPLPVAGWVVIWDGRSGFVRTSATSGIALDQGDNDHPPLALTLSLTAASATLPDFIEIRYSNEVEPSRRTLPCWPDLPVKLTLGVPWDWRCHPLPQNAPNLLWGELAPKANWLEWLPRLRPLALILAAALGIEMLGANLEWALLHHQKTVITQDMARTFRAVFGDESVVVNPALQMRRKLAELRHTTGLPDEADFLPLLDQVSTALSNLPNGSIRGLHYDSGKLAVELSLSREADIQTLRHALQQRGLSVLPGEIRTGSGGIETQLTIQWEG